MTKMGKCSKLIKNIFEIKKNKLWIIILKKVKNLHLESNYLKKMKKFQLTLLGSKKNLSRKEIIIFKE